MPGSVRCRGGSGGVAVPVLWCSLSPHSQRATGPRSGWSATLTRDNDECHTWEQPLIALAGAVRPPSRSAKLRRRRGSKRGRAARRPSPPQCSALLGCDVGLLDGALPALYVDLFDCALLGARRRVARRSTARCSAAAWACMTARCSALDGAGFRSTTRCSALDDPLLGCGAGLLDSALLGARRGACSTARCSVLDVDLFDCALLCARRGLVRPARCSALDDPLLGARRGLIRLRAARLRRGPEKTI